MIKKKTAATKLKKKKVSAVKAKTSAKKAAKAVKKKAVAVKPAPKATPKATPPKVENKQPLISAEGYAVTGHEWDGIQEFNNPLPRWWVWVFIACIVYAIGYVIYYPSLPNWDGLSGQTQLVEFKEDMAKQNLERAPFDAKIEGKEVADILEDAETLTYAVAAGKALFALNCSQCHGAAGQGGKGYPSFLDDEWLHGGKLEDILYTITHGIRNLDDPKARNNAVMAAWGDQEILSKQEIRDVVRYIKVMAEGYSENESSERGKEIFTDNCASCHGQTGEGNHEFGAPQLSNQIWLYGGKSKDLEETIMHGRAGVMPAFGLKLSPVEVKKLALYVFSLTGGEDVIETTDEEGALNGE